MRCSIIIVETFDTIKKLACIIDHRCYFILFIINKFLFFIDNYNNYNRLLI